MCHLFHPCDESALNGHIILGMLAVRPYLCPAVANCSDVALGENPSALEWQTEKMTPSPCIRSSVRRNTHGHILGIPPGVSISSHSSRDLLQGNTGQVRSGSPNQGEAGRVLQASTLWSLVRPCRVPRRLAMGSLGRCIARAS